jgi:hypothetical protein
MGTKNVRAGSDKRIVKKQVTGGRESYPSIYISHFELITPKPLAK